MTTELDQLAGFAAEVDATTKPPELTPEGQPVPVLDFGTEAQQAVDMFAGLVTGYAPATAELWSADAKARVSATLAPVLEKYGVTVGTLPPELLLIVTAGPLLYQTSKIVALQMQSDKAKPAPAAVSSAPTSAKPEAPEQLVHSQVALYQ